MKPFNLILENFLKLCVSGVKVHADCVRFCEQVSRDESEGGRRRLAYFLQSHALEKFYGELAEMVSTIQPFSKKKLPPHPSVPDTEEAAMAFADAYRAEPLDRYLMRVIKTPRRRIDDTKACTIL